MTFPAKRRYGQFLVLAAFAGAVLIPPYAALTHLLPALSPFVSISSAVSLRAAGLALLLTMPVLVFVALRRRAFCFYLCPMGLILDGCARARRARGAYPGVPQLGKWVALLTFGGALAGYPLFLFLDPLAILSGAAGAAEVPSSPSAWGYAALFTGVLTMGFVFPHLWCRRLCPLGGTQEAIADLCQTLKRHKPAPQGGPSQDAPAPSRRAFLSGGAGLGAGAACSLAAVRIPVETGTHTLRPPGAESGALLNTLCVRCGNCVRSCPTGIIRAETHPSNPAALLTPTIDFESGHCLDTCNACGANCPTGVIPPLDLKTKNDSKIGLAHIDRNACLLTFEKECNACVVICPRNAVIEEFNRETYTASVTIDREACNGCGACIAVCPERAIRVESA